MKPQWQFYPWEGVDPEEDGFLSLHIGPFELCVYVYDDADKGEIWRCDLLFEDCNNEIAFRNYPTEAAALTDAIPLLIETLGNWMTEASRLITPITAGNFQQITEGHNDYQIATI